MGNDSLLAHPQPGSHTLNHLGSNAKQHPHRAPVTPTASIGVPFSTLIQAVERWVHLREQDHTVAALERRFEHIEGFGITLHATSANTRAWGET